MAERRDVAVTSGWESLTAEQRGADPSAGHVFATRVPVVGRPPLLFGDPLRFGVAQRSAVAQRFGGQQ